MKVNLKGSLPDGNGLFKLKNKEWLEKQRVAGKIAANALSMLEHLVKERTEKSLLELDRLAYEYINDHGCQPTFLGYHNFPNSCCISVNKQLVHGIPTNYVLQEGDLVSFDLGATYQESIADTAITCIYGEAKSEYVKLVSACETALMEGINAIAVGKRLGVIGNAIYKSARNNGFSVVTQYGGHGICNHADGKGMPHAPPFVSNKASSDEGIRIQPNMVLAIEPLLVLGGSTGTKVDKDGWTVWSENISAHFEHSVFIHEDHVEIITDRRK